MPEATLLSEVCAPDAEVVAENAGRKGVDFQAVAWKTKSISSGLVRSELKIASGKEGQVLHRVAILGTP